MCVCRGSRLALPALSSFVCLFLLGVVSGCGTEKGRAQALVRGAGRERAGTAGGGDGGCESPWSNGGEGRKSPKSDLVPAPEGA